MTEKELYHAFLLAVLLGEIAPQEPQTLRAIARRVVRAAVALEAIVTARNESEPKP